MKIKNLKYFLLILIALAIISLILPIFTDLSFLESARIIFGSVYVLFLPGYLLTFIFFHSSKSQIDQLERFALSIALSIAIVPLIVFYINLIGIKISALTTFSAVLAILVICALILFFINKNGK